MIYGPKHFGKIGYWRDRDEYLSVSAKFIAILDERHSPGPDWSERLKQAESRMRYLWKPWWHVSGVLEHKYQDGPWDARIAELIAEEDKKLEAQP